MKAITLLSYIALFFQLIFVTRQGFVLWISYGLRKRFRNEIMVYRREGFTHSYPFWYDKYNYGEAILFLKHWNKWTPNQWYKFLNK